MCYMRATLHAVGMHVDLLPLPLASIGIGSTLTAMQDTQMYNRKGTMHWRMVIGLCMLSLVQDGARPLAPMSHVVDCADSPLARLITERRYYMALHSVFEIRLHAQGQQER